MMLGDQKLYLMLHNEADHSPDYGEFVSGCDPVAAVEAHYAEMDAWCSPVRDPDFHEEFCVSLHEIPQELAEIVKEQFEGLRGGEYSGATTALLAKYPAIKVVELNIVLSADGCATASLMPDAPHLFGSFGKG